MARGKHSNASSHRRMVAAEDEVALLRKALRREEREHAVTRRIAERVDGLEEACRSLRMNLELATCAEIAELTEQLAATRAAGEERLWATLTVFAEDANLEMTGPGFGRLRDVIGADVFERWMHAASGKAVTRSKRRRLRQVAGSGGGAVAYEISEQEPGLRREQGLPGALKR